MIQTLIKIYRQLLFAISKSARIRHFLYMNGLRKYDYKLISNNELFLSKFGLRVSIENQSFIVRGYSNLLRIKNSTNAKFTLLGNNLSVEILGLNLIARTSEEIFILWEVFVNNCYNLDCNKPLIVIDIGMNVGYTSLFLATKNNVIRVYGYEPFKATFEDALENLKNNSIYSKKIIPINCGVGYEDKEIICEYSPEWKGKGGIEPLSEEIRNSSSIENELIRLKNIEILLDQLVNENPGFELAIKMDCEGSEYEILNKLCTSKSFDSVKTLMIEWHKLGNKIILEKLLPLGFKTISHDSEYSDIGMIYAFR